MLGRDNLAFMGSNVVSGSAAAIVIAVGDDTVLGSLARQVTARKPKTSFEKGVNSVSWVLIRFMLVMVPIVLFLNGFTKGDWMQAFLFAISVAVGLTPEMLPMIVSANLARGAVAMSKEKVIVKQLGAIQNFGAMDVLCTDKTGTLTQDKVVLEYSLDIHGKKDARVLRHAFLNSYHQTGLRNLMDVAVMNLSLIHILLCAVLAMGFTACAQQAAETSSAAPAEETGAQVQDCLLYTSRILRRLPKSTACLGG